jgi:hypothetical protein
MLAEKIGLEGMANDTCPTGGLLTPEAITNRVQLSRRQLFANAAIAASRVAS